MSTEYDAVVVGAGPNGLAAALTIARAGRSVLVVEAAESVGGGCRTAALTLPGYRHDVCSAIHPLAAASPFLRRLPLAEHGLSWVSPPAALAHPFDDRPAAILEGSVEQTASGLDRDGEGWQAQLGPLVEAWPRVERRLLGPLSLSPRGAPDLLRFAVRGLRSASGFARSAFQGARTRGLLAGLAAHSVLPLDRAGTSAIALVLAVAGHRVGWPFPAGGAGELSAAMASYLRSLGGAIQTGCRVDRLEELPAARVVLLDTTPRELVRLAGARLPRIYRWRLGRFRHGPGVFKLDLALDGPIPWRDGACSRAGTVHLGGALEEVERSEAEVWAGRLSERPFVLLAQHTPFDRSRAPAGGHTVWAYCHVPHGSGVDATAAIEAQIERFAPGVRDRIVGRHRMTALELERYNRNYVGGDIGGGVADLGQLFARPVARLVPYRTPVAGLYLCSSSTPPGGGVHGLCGYHAATAALARELA